MIFSVDAVLSGMPRAVANTSPIIVMTRVKLFDLTLWQALILVRTHVLLRSNVVSMLILIITMGWSRKMSIMEPLF